MLRKFSAVGVSSVLIKCCFVLGVSLFKCSFCQSYIVHGFVLCCYFCVVNSVGGEAFVVKRALFFVAAIALLKFLCIVVIVVVGYFHVVFVNNGFHIVHTTVGHFYIVFVKKTVVVVALAKT